MRKKFLEGKKFLAGLLTAAMTMGTGFGGMLPNEQVEAASQPTLTVDLTEETGDIIHGAAGFLYGISSEEVPTTNTMVPLKPKVLCTKGALGTEHPYGDAFDVAKTFLESGGEQVMMYNSNYYGVFGVTAHYQDYAKVLKETIAPAVVEWKNAWKADHTDDNLKEVDIDKAIIYIPINEGTPKVGTDFNTAWKAYYDAIKEVDRNAVIAGPNSAAYNTQFGSGVTMKSYIQYCADNDCMPDVITWHDLQVDKLERLNGETKDFKNIWNRLNWTQYKIKHPEQFEGGKSVPELPQICINEYADYADCGVPGRLVNWIARLEDEKIYGCLPFWHQANNLNDLTADANEGNGAWWLYKWYGDMSGKTVKVTTNTSYDRLYGVASIDKTKKIATTLLGGVDGAASVNLLHVKDTETFQDAEKVHVKVQSTAFSGYHGARNDTPVIMDGTFPVNSDGSVTLSLKNMKFSTAYNVTITEAGETDEVTDPVINNYQRVWEAEEAEVSDGCRMTGEGNYNPRYYLSAGKMVEMPKDTDLTYQFQVPVDGKYQLDFIYGNGTGSARNDMARHNPQNIMQAFTIDGQNAADVVMENTLLTNMTGIKTLYADLSAGEHTVHIKTAGDGTVAHDSLTVTWFGAKEQEVKRLNNRYEAEQADFNLLLGNQDTMVKTETAKSGYSSNGYVTGLDKRKVTQGGGIRWNVVVKESGLYNVTLRYQSDADGIFNLYLGNTATILNRVNKALPIKSTANDWSTATASIYLQRGINILDIDADTPTALDYMQVQAVREEDNAQHAAVIEAEDCIPEGSAIQTKESSGASKGTYVVGMEGDANAENDKDKYLAFEYQAPTAGTYQLRIYQSNNDICGQHSYNTKIIDKYASVKVNDQDAKRYFFINTFSDDTFKEKTVTIDLNEGKNTIKIFNDDSWQVKWGGTTSTPGENVLDNYAPNFDRFVIMPLNLENPIVLPTAYGVSVETTSGGYATTDKNSVEEGGELKVSILPDKGIQKILVNGVEKTQEAQAQDNGSYLLSLKDVREDIKVSIYFMEGYSEHTDSYIKNAGFGTGNTNDWTADNTTVDKTAADSLEGYYAVLQSSSKLSQQITALPAGKYSLSLFAKGSSDAQGKLLVRAAGGTQERAKEIVPNTEEYEENLLTFEAAEGNTVVISVDASGLTGGSMYVDNFSLTALEERPEEEISDTYEYFVDCGDHNPDTLADNVQFGKWNHVTDKVYGEDIRTGYSWGVVTSDSDPVMQEPLGSRGSYTKYQWANENVIIDKEPMTSSFRYAHNQKENGIDPRYVKYRFQVETGVYQVSVGMGNTWGNSANPDIYAGTGDSSTDIKLNKEPMRIVRGESKKATGTVKIAEGQDTLDVYAVSEEDTINMNYIQIRKLSDNVDNTLKALEITPPAKTLYDLGDEFDTAGMTVTAVYEDDSRVSIHVEDCIIEGFDSSKEGQQEVTVKYSQDEKTVQAAVQIIVRALTESKLLYFTDCGDHNPATVTQGDALGEYNSVTDKIYGIDTTTQKSWGVVISDEDKEIAPPQGSQGIYTTYQWANEQNKSDGLAKTGSFRYARGQDSAGFGLRYVKYRYELEPGTYQVTVNMKNNWGNAGNPDIYAGSTGDRTQDTKMNKSPLEIGNGANKEIKADIIVPEGSNTMDVYALSSEPTINMSYILIEQVTLIQAPEVTGLELTPPNKTEYYQGDQLELEGLKVMAVYADGSKREIMADACTVEGFDGNTIGEQTVTVKYTEDDKTVDATFKVQVKEEPPAEAELTGLEVKAPTKTEYLQGEELDTAGMEVKAVYSDGQKKEVEIKNCILEGYDKTSVGKQTVTVKYTEKAKTVEGTFEVEVKEAPPAEAELTGLEVKAPTKTEYQQGEELDTAGMEVKAVYSDGQKKAVEIKDCILEGYDKTSVGKQTVTVKYAENGRTEKGRFEVRVMQKQDNSGTDSEPKPDPDKKPEPTPDPDPEPAPDEKKPSVPAGNWVSNASGWWYQYDNGGFPAGEWLYIEGQWYYFNSDGYMASGWINNGNVWYYTNESGMMQTGWINDKGIWYYTNESGVLQTGWVNANNIWYYTNESGTMQTGWQNLGYKWYYLSEDGGMQTGWIQENGTWYYADESGALQTGWIQENGIWYYTDESGAMQTGWVELGGRWYYLSENGAMQTGWLQLEDEWYYLKEDGAMADNKLTIDGTLYYFFSNGRWEN